MFPIIANNGSSIFRTSMSAYMCSVTKWLKTGTIRLRAEPGTRLRGKEGYAQA